MEEFIQKILLLDKKTKELSLASESELEKKKEETLSFINSFELKGHEESKQKAQESYARVYQEAMNEVDRIRKENQDLVESLDDFYHKNEERLVDQAFSLLGLGKED